jgi:hypothetical protein
MSGTGYFFSLSSPERKQKEWVDWGLGQHTRVILFED